MLVQDMKKYFVFSEFPSRPISFLVAIKASVFFYSMYSTQYINIININYKLMCIIQFKALLICMNPPNGKFESKVEKQTKMKQHIAKRVYMNFTMG